MNNQTPTPAEVGACLEAAYAAIPSPYRELIEHLLETGEITSETTIADARVALEKYNSAGQ